MSYLGSTGHLATITSVEEQAFINANVFPGQFEYVAYWLGAYQLTGSLEPSGGWQWITGEPWGYTNWSANEPNNTGGVEDGLHLFYEGPSIQGKWNDLPRERVSVGTPLGYIVEFAPGNIDLRPISLSWNQTLGGVDFVISATGDPLSTATTAKLFWANGTTVTNILSSTAIFTNNIPAGFTGQSAKIHIPGSLLHDAPLETTHMLLVLDRENLVAESSETNNALALADVTVVPKTNTVNMGVLSSYTINAIKDSLRRAAELKAIVNSTKRSTREQAEAVCGNIQKKGLASQKRLYGANPPMTAALDAYEDSRDDIPLPACADVLTSSLDASVAGGAQLGSISKHLGDYSRTQAVDVSYNNAINKKLLWSAFLANPKISKTIGPPNDPALHIEIPQTAAQTFAAEGIAALENINMTVSLSQERDNLLKNIASTKGGGSPRELEAGETPICVSNPTPIPIVGGLGSISGTVSNGHSSYKFEARAGDLLNLGVNVTSHRLGAAFDDDDSMVYLVDSSCTLLASNDDTDIFASEMHSAIQDFLIPSNGTYYVVVTTFENVPVLSGVASITGWQDNGGSDVDYDLSVALLSPVLDIHATTNNQAIITWGVGATLQQSSSPVGPWMEVSGALSPFLIQISEQARFFRYRKN